MASKSAFKRFIDYLGKQTNLNTLSYLPRWAILAFDVVILVVAMIVTRYTIHRIKDISGITILPVWRDWVLIGFNLFYFVLLKTYAGLIRHSTFLDTLKFLIASLLTAFSGLVVHYVLFFSGQGNTYTWAKLILFTIISFCGLFLFRAVIKQLFSVFYYRFLNEDNSLKALVYGTDESAIAIANALKSERPRRYRVIGFLDNERKNSSKQILGLPIIYDEENPIEIIKQYTAEALILASKNLTKSERIDIVDDCINNNIKVFRAPILSDINDNKSLATQIKKIQIEDILERDPIQLDNKRIAKELENKCILITGGGGSIGSEIVRQVANYKPSKLLILDQAETPLYRIDLEISKSFPNLNIEAIICDVKNKTDLEVVFKTHQPHVIYHAAAYKHVPLMEKHPSQAVLSNILGSKNTADLALKYSAEKFVMVSTDKAVNPSNVMGASKRIAEIYIQSLFENSKKDANNKTNFVITRFGNVLGSNGSVVPLFKRQLEQGGPLTITHPDIIRYFMTIPEACQLVLEAGAMGNGGEIFIFDMGKAVKILDLAKKIILLAGYQPYKDIDIEVIGLRPGEKLYEELLTDKAETLPTHHNKILIAKEDIYNFTVLVNELKQLEELTKEKDTFALVRQMKKLVPEFISMNSEYQNID